MAVRRVKIEGLPKAENGMHVMTSVPRNQANVEAEKGETMVTADVSSNRKELVAIGGKKHSQGGTPINAPVDSAIYSDKLKITDPIILKFFNESGKKPKTFAELSKKYDISKLNEKRENPLNDKITNNSIDKSLEDANFKLSALFTLQEFHEEKGKPDEHSEHFEPFMERMRLDYDDLLGTKGEEGGTGMTPEMKHGGIVFDQLPIAATGDEIVAPPYNENQAFDKVGIERLNEYLNIYGIQPLNTNASKSAVLAKIKEAQSEAVRQNPNLIFDYMTTDTEDTTKSHRPNNKLQGIMKGISNTKVKPSGADGTYTNDDLRAMLEEGSLNTDNVLDAYQDNKWWYRMVNADIKEVSQEEMARKKELLDKEGIEQGGIRYLHLGDGYYEAYKTKPNGEIVKVEPDPAAVDKIHQWNVEHLSDTPEDPKNMDFLWANKRALRQAKKAKRNIPYIEPFTPVADTQFTDMAYYNPDQAINAIQSMVNTQGDKLAMFAPQQQQTANFLAGQQFDAIAKVIGNYEDKNITAYNQEQSINTQIANQASDRLARAIESHHNKTATLKQNYANAINAADKNIAENEIAMWQERADRLNMEKTIGEQYAVNPNTGIIEFQKGKDFFPNASTQKDAADVFMDLKQKMPGASDDVIAKLTLSSMSGKYSIEPTQHPQNAQGY